MQRVIDGKLYDTETSTLVASALTSGLRWEGPMLTADAETLYRTRKNNWWAATNSGLARALDEFQARDWLRKHNRPKELGEHFGLAIEEA